MNYAGYLLNELAIFSRRNAIGPILFLPFRGNSKELSNKIGLSRNFFYVIDLFSGESLSFLCL